MGEQVHCCGHSVVLVTVYTLFTMSYDTTLSPCPFNCQVVIVLPSHEGRKDSGLCEPYTKLTIDTSTVSAI